MDDEQKTSTKLIPETWLEEMVVPKYWKQAQRFFNYRNGWVAFSNKDEEKIEHFRNVRELKKNLDSFKEVYNYSENVRGPRILYLKFGTKFNEKFEVEYVNYYVRTTKSQTTYEKLDQNEIRLIFYDAEWETEVEKAEEQGRLDLNLKEHLPAAKISTNDRIIDPRDTIYDEDQLGCIDYEQEPYYIDCHSKNLVLPMTEMQISRIKYDTRTDSFKGIEQEPRLNDSVNITPK